MVSGRNGAPSQRGEQRCLRKEPQVMASVLQLELEPLLWEKLSVYLSSCIIFTGRLQSGLFFFSMLSFVLLIAAHQTPEHPFA